MANCFMRFPGGRDRALTLSYDDGVEQDIRLIDILRRNGLKGTFNINSGLYAPEGTIYPEGEVHRRMTFRTAHELYKNSGMEVAVHGLTHPFLEKLPAAVCNYEVLQDRINLEREFDCIVRGMAYPCGTYSDEVVEVLKQCQIQYARTIESTGRFDIPTNWLRLPVTCHHNDPRLMKLAEDFVNAEKVNDPYLFYLWGHSYEFERMDNWNVIEEFAQYMGGRSNVWYATNAEIFEYISAYRHLVFSASGEKVYNPSCISVYFTVQDKVCCVKPGATISYAK